MGHLIKAPPRRSVFLLFVAYHTARFRPGRLPLVFWPNKKALQAGLSEVMLFVNLSCLN